MWFPRDVGLSRKALIFSKSLVDAQQALVFSEAVNDSFAKLDVASHFDTLASFCLWPFILLVFQHKLQVLEYMGVGAQLNMCVSLSSESYPSSPDLFCSLPLLWILYIFQSFFF